MNTLLLLIYHQSPALLSCGCVVATAVFWLLDRQFGRRRWWRALIGTMLILWGFAVLYVTVLSRSGGAYGSFRLVPLHSYREVLATGNREILRSSFMNALLFFPAGLLGAVLLPRRKKLWLVLGVAVFSLTIELLQFWFSLGNAEIDDIFHNTLGAWLGTALGVFRGPKTE